MNNNYNKGFEINFERKNLPIQMIFDNKKVQKLLSIKTSSLNIPNTLEMCL